MLRKDFKMILSFKHRKWKKQNYVLDFVFYTRQFFGFCFSKELVS